MFSFFLGLFAKFWSEFCKRCFWVFRPMGGCLSTSAKPFLQLLSSCFPFFLLFRAVTVCIMFSLFSVGFRQFCFSTDHHGDLQRISCRMGVCCFLSYELKMWERVKERKRRGLRGGGGGVCKLRNKCLSKVRTQQVLFLFVHP